MSANSGAASVFRSSISPFLGGRPRHGTRFQIRPLKTETEPDGLSGSAKAFGDPKVCK